MIASLTSSTKRGNLRRWVTTFWLSSMGAARARTASSRVMYPSSSIRSMTRFRLAMDASLFSLTAGEYRSGAAMSPARVAASGRVRFLALLPK